ncbi:hypothetical protein R5R35_001949 [Gryllus longicercus]|uniref:CHK kinase-like domain-containing protein n=1 Tax=Gryllus longicercus TaxID=2509291 RepID=A0AAN9W7R6_9ORTH
MSTNPKPAALTKQEQESDGSWIDEGILKQIVKQGAAIQRVNVERATGKGDNYLSIIYRVRAEYQLQDSDHVHCKRLIIKGLPDGEYMLGLIEELNLFRREVSIYRDILPKLYAFADSQLGNDSFKRFSADYHETDRANTIILDDLKFHGFVMASRKDRLDFSHAKLVIQSLARLHAVSIAYTKKNPNFLSQFEECMYCESNRERLLEFIPPTLRDITEVVKKWEGFDKIEKKLERLQETLMDKLIDMCNFKGFQHVLLHGDTWVNNILFKYTETGEPVDVRFVDYQITRKNSPAFDLQYFLFSSLQSDILFLHYDSFLREYYNELKDTVNKLDYGCELFTFDEFDQEMKRTSCFGLYSAISILAVVLANPNDIIDLEKLTLENGEIQLFNKVYESPEFRKAFEPVLLYFNERGVLD